MKDLIVRFEGLESRQMFDADPSVQDIYVFTTGGNDKVLVDCSEYSDTRIVTISVNGHDQQFNSPFYQRVHIIDPGGNDTFTVGQGPIGVRFEIIDVDGNDTLNVPYADALRGRIVFKAGAGNDKINVTHSYGDEKAEKIKLEPGEIQWNPSRYIQHSDVEKFDITGTEAGDTFDVGYVNSDQNVTLRGGKGDDAIDVGRGDIDSNINGHLTVLGESGQDGIRFLDGSDGGDDKYRLDYTSLAKPTALVNPIQYGAERVELDANQHKNVITVPNMYSTLAFIKAGGGDDELRVGDGYLEPVKNARVHFEGGPGTDIYVVNDSKDTVARQIKVQGNFIRRPGAKDLTFTTTERVRILAGRGSDTLDASATSVRVNIVGGTGNDTILGGNNADTLVGGAGDDVIRSNAGNDILIGGQGADDLDGGPGDDVKLQDDVI